MLWVNTTGQLWTEHSEDEDKTWSCVCVMPVCQHSMQTLKVWTKPHNIFSETLLSSLNQLTENKLALRLFLNSKRGLFEYGVFLYMYLNMM